MRWRTRLAEWLDPRPAPPGGVALPIAAAEPPRHRIIEFGEAEIWPDGWLRVGVQIKCSTCGRTEAVETKYERATYLSSCRIGPYLNWVLPEGWYRVSVNGKESLVCDQHECLVPRP